MNAISIKKLTKSFKSNLLLKKTQVLKDININVNKGEIYGFLGPNGAGKTTTIKCLLSLTYPDSGEMTILGKPAKDIEMRKNIGFLPEHPYFYDYLTGTELLRFYARLFSIRTRNLDRRINFLIESVGLKGKENIKLKKYSKGMIQRIGLAQSLINDPEIIILDEPFSGLDPLGRKELRDIILSLKETGKTIFFSSHILQDIEHIVDKVGIIIHGKTQKEGNLSELITRSIQYFEIVFSCIDQKIFAKHKLKIDQKDNKFFVQVEEKKKDSILETIILNKGRIDSVTPIKMTLEDIFLKETQQ